MVHEIEVISSLMLESYEIDISAFGEAFLVRTIEQRMKTVGTDDYQNYHDYLKVNADEAKTLGESLLINYSRFFRETMTFCLLENFVFPNMVDEKNGGELRIWSTGCSRGQEAYSIAILLKELADESGKEIRFRIFATDISQSVLDSACAGVYDFDAVQNIRLKHLEKYFTKVGNKYILSHKIKQHVHFSHYDILDPDTVHPPESIFGDFDLVICSNLLIYYKPIHQQAILHRLKQSLAPNGYLVTGEAERMLVQPGEKLQAVSAIAPIFRNKQRRKFP
ncbi:MAG: protein-glutamate O-methyltransferase CheR [Erysipelotrichaceae bacterium]